VEDFDVVPVVFGHTASVVGRNRQTSLIETIGGASRIALLGSSPVDRIIANFTIERQTLPCPTRFFTSRDEALGWLIDPALS
jgi:hypothetical protein